MQADLTEITVCRAKTVPSDYIGTKTEYVENGMIQAQIQPVTDKLSVALYGNRVENMRNLICPHGSDIKKGDKVRLDGIMYKVVGQLTYSTHIAAVAEAEGTNENRSKGA